MAEVILTDDTANASLDAVGAKVDGGTVRIWTAGRATLLATLTLSNPAFAAAASRIKSINTVTGSTAAAAGDPVEAEFRNSSAVEKFSGPVGATGSGALITFDNVTGWQIGNNINVTGGTLRIPAQ